MDQRSRARSNAKTIVNQLKIECGLPATGASRAFHIVMEHLMKDATETKRAVFDHLLTNHITRIESALDGLVGAMDHTSGGKEEEHEPESTPD